MSLRVASIGVGATLQDAGRPGHRHHGVPVGGAFDRDAIALGNSLLGNILFAPAIEFVLMGGVFVAEAEIAIAVTGALCEVAIRDENYQTNIRLLLNKGDKLEIGRMRQGVRVYLCVEGGFRSELLLGSTSGTAVLREQVLKFAAVKTRVNETKHVKAQQRVAPIRIVSSGRHSAEDIFSTEFTVSTQSDRRGVRLDGMLAVVEEELPSEPACVGAVQLTPSGQLVVIGPDGPTIGGYPKVGYLCEADLPILAQMRPGEKVRFQEIGIENARIATREFEKTLLARASVLRP